MALGGRPRSQRLRPVDRSCSPAGGAGLLFAGFRPAQMPLQARYAPTALTRRLRVRFLLIAGDSRVSVSCADTELSVWRLSRPVGWAARGVEPKDRQSDLNSGGERPNGMRRRRPRLAVAG